MNPREINRRAWNAQVQQGNEWTVPVGADEIARARRGEWSVVLTPQKPVPRSWFGDIAGKRVLGLASAGGQQCPLFAAAGAKVTVFDNSPAQLAQDRAVAEREGLEIELVEGDMARLDGLEDNTFDLVFHPCSNCFAAEVRPVWREVYRVLRPGGALLSGLNNPLLYVFDSDALERGELDARYSVPYSDLKDLPPEQLERRLAANEPVEFGHSLEDLIGGQLDAGLLLTGFYEDTWDVSWLAPLASKIPVFFATRAEKPR